MKTTIFFRICIVLIGALLASCSKDRSFSGQANDNAGNTSAITSDNAGKFSPQTYGSITGALVPLPLKASVIAYDNNGFSRQVTLAGENVFRIEGLPPGDYLLVISYVLPQRGAVHSEIKLPGLHVSAGTTTDLGDILLP